MKKNSLFLIILSLAYSNLFADISAKQIDEYLKISRGGQVLHFYQKILSRGISNSIKVNNRELAMQKIFDASRHKGFVQQFIKGFIELDENTYNEIMHFYQTEEGMKSVNATIDFSAFDNNKTELQIIRKKCKNFLREDCFKYIDLMEWDTFSKKKKKLINQVFESFDTIKIKRDLRRQSLLMMNLVYKKPYQYSHEFIEEYATYNDPNYHQTTSNITYLFFKDFTEDELEKIVDFALSKASQKEYFLIEEGIKLYTYTFIQAMMQTFEPYKCKETIE